LEEANNCNSLDSDEDPQLSRVNVLLEKAETLQSLW